MDNELEKILKDIQEGVILSIQFYKRHNDIKFIELPISNLNGMITSVRNSGKSNTDGFVSAIQGMVDELNVIIEDHKTKEESRHDFK